MKRVERYYDNNTLREWQRLERHRTEYALTLRALARHLPPAPARIADIGGGPGRYAIPLTQQGYAVTLLDLSAGNLAFAQDKAAEAGVTLAEVVCGNALDLAQFADESFDAVLLLGPLYHLVVEDQRRGAVRESLRILKPGGMLAAAFINRLAVVRWAASEEPLWPIEKPDEVERLMSTGVNEDQGAGFTDAYFCHPDEIMPLMESCGLHTVELVGCEGAVSRLEAHINALEGAAFEAWADLNERIARDPTLLPSAEHLLYIGRKLPPR